MKPSLLLLVCCLWVAGGPGVADPIRVAVASNFRNTLGVIVDHYTRETGQPVVLSAGATGKHYAQIVNGAPFDVFFAADARRPALLEQAGIARPGSRYTYALGRLLLWSPDPDQVDPAGEVLAGSGFRHLAIANPRLAPYGRAARQVLQAKSLWESLQPRIVRGENIAQTLQFVRSGNAELGFIAYAQFRQPGLAASGSWWEVPAGLHEPIEQQAVLLRDSAPAADFLAYVRSAAMTALIRSHGYDTP